MTQTTDSEKVYTVVVRDLSLDTDDTVITTRTLERAKELMNATVADFFVTGGNTLVKSEDDTNVYDEYQEVVDAFITENYIV